MTLPALPPDTELEPRKPVQADHLKAFKDYITAVRDQALAPSDVVADAAIDRAEIAGRLLSPTNASAGYSAAFVLTGAGIDPTGVADSRAAIQAKLDAAAASIFTKMVQVPVGTYKINDRLAVPAGVTLRGVDRTSSKIVSAGAAQGVLLLTGVADVTVCDLNLVHGSGIGGAGVGIVIVGDAGAGVTQERVTVTRCRISGSTNDGVRFPNAVKYLTFSDNLVEDCTAGFTCYQPPVGFVSSGINITGNRFRNVGGNNLQLFGGNDPANIRFRDVLIAYNHLSEFAQIGAYGPIPMEPTGIRGLIVAFNRIVGPSTRGVSMGNNIDTTVVGNYIRGQSTYAFEMNGGRDYVLTGNTVEDCASFTMETGNGLNGTGRLTGVAIVGNIFRGTGLASAGVGVDVIKLTTARRVRITGNLFQDWQYARSCIRVGEQTPASEDVTVEANTFLLTDPNTPLTAVAVRRVKRCNVRLNTVTVLRDLAAATDDWNSTFNITMDPDSSEVVVEDNTTWFVGATVGAPNCWGGVSTNNGVPGPLPGCRVNRNRVVGAPGPGVYLRVNSSDLQVFDNDTRACGAPDVLPDSLVIRRTALVIDATAAPTVGTWRRGDIARNRTPAVAGGAGAQYVVSGWICTVAGTPGTWVEQRTLTGS